MPGEKCEVHSPKPKGAGTAPKNTSSGIRPPDIAARLVEEEPTVFRVHHTLGQARRARGRIEHEEIIRAEAPSIEKSSRFTCIRSRHRLPVNAYRWARLGQHVRHDDVTQSGQTVGAQPFDQLGGRLLVEVFMREEGGGAGPSQEVADLCSAGSGANAATTKPAFSAARNTVWTVAPSGRRTPASSRTREGLAQAWRPVPVNARGIASKSERSHQRRPPRCRRHRRDGSWRGRPPPRPRIECPTSPRQHKLG